MKIYFLNGEMSGVKVQLEEITTIGRDESNTLPISGLGISRHHATFFLDKGIWKVRDGGSTNGVRVNHQRIDTEEELHEGDIIELGNQTIRFGEVPKNSGAVNSSEPELSTESGNATVHLDHHPVPKKKNKIVFQPQQGDAKSGLKIKSSPHSTKSLKATKKLSVMMDVTSDDNQAGHKGKKHPTEALASRELSDALKNGKISLFKPAAEQAMDNEQSLSTGKNHKFSNLLFYVIVICVAVIIVVLFLKSQAGGLQSNMSVKPVKKIPKLFLLTYEKTKFSVDNIFRFYMKIENRKAYFSIDDLKSQRSYEKSVKITQDQLDDLQNEIEQSDILQAKAPPPGTATNELDETKRLIICYNGQLKELKIINNSEPGAFMKITDMINDFVGLYGLQTIAMTPDELKEKAEEMFNKAEILFHNRAGNPANLRKAVLRYNMAEEFLSQFSPKPPMWSKAKKQAGIAENMRKTRLKELSRDELKYRELREYEKRDEVLTEMMQLCLPESKLYEDVRKAKINNDEKIRSLNKR